MHLKITLVLIALGLVLAQTDYSKTYSVHWRLLDFGYTMDPLLDLQPNDLFFTKLMKVALDSSAATLSYTASYQRGDVPQPKIYQNRITLTGSGYYMSVKNFTWTEYIDSFYLATRYTIAFMVITTNKIPYFTDTEFTVHWSTSNPYNFTVGVDPNDDPLYSRYALVPSPEGCGFAEFKNSKLFFTPYKKGICQITMNLTDNCDVTEAKTISIIVKNTSPFAPNISLATFWKKSFEPLDILSKVNETDGDNITFVGFGQSYPSNCSNFIWNSQTKRVEIQHYGIGVCSIEYNVTDGEAYSTGFLNLNVFNNAPVVVNKYITVHWKVHQAGFYLTQLLEGSYDPDNDTVSIIGLGDLQPSEAGTYTAVDDKFLIKSLSSSTFVNKNITIPYYVTDGVYKTTGFIYIKVYNNAPSCTERKLTKHWTEHRDGFFINNILENTSDLDADSISLDSIQGISPSDAGVISLSALNIKNQANLGSLFVNKDYTISFKISDGIEKADCRIVVRVYNNAPKAIDDAFTINTFNRTILNVLLNDFDPDQPNFDKTLKVKSINYKGNSYVNYNSSTNILSIIPDSKNLTMGETFRYKITDGIEDSEGTVTIYYKVKVSSSSKTLMSLMICVLMILLF